MEDRHADNPIKIPEISADEFRACEDQDDFLRRYGNPVMIRSNGQRDVVCMAREYYERLMQERDLFIEDENIKYWIYEFEASQEKKLELERAAAKCCMTPDEFFEATIEAGLRKAETDSEGSDRQYREQPQETERVGIRLVRFYPVFKGETEAQALKRKLAEEAAEGVDDKHV
ncbi:hypothetical protein [Chordicoccus furentiruminis]|uniref:hypothetical protein n=1 Tax=Chordicoccus furentiruminis TaxID=2709410 RepID=UPI0023A7B9BC|nr:hypothetical protein [Chordicoccus furentiruminis]